MKQCTPILIKELKYSNIASRADGIVVNKFKQIEHVRSRLAGVIDVR
jgi:hypothetical protein